MTRTAVLFPGQGWYLRGFLAECPADCDRSREALDAVDKVALEYGHAAVSVLLGDLDGPDIEEPAHAPALLSLAIFATSIRLNVLLEAEGMRADILVGHSIGEITALAVAGVLDVADAARVICERHAALDALGLPAGGMVALGMGQARADDLRRTVDDWSLAVAAVNSPRQSVVSGLHDGLVLLERVAATLGVAAGRLPTRHPYHNPLLAPAARRLAQATRDIELHEPLRRVYSPILGRYLVHAEDARELIARHLTGPVRYQDAVRELYDDGVDTFVEGGARQVLTDLAQQCLPPVRVAAPLARRATASQVRANLAGLIGDLLAGGPAEVAGPTAARRISAPAAQRIRPASSMAETTAAQPLPVLEAPPVVGDPRIRTGAVALPGHDELVGQLRQMFAGAVGYPPDVFADDAELEADLGISSIKQVEVFTQVLDRYGLPNPSRDFRLRAYATLPKIADLLRRLAAGSPVAGR